MAAEQDYIDSAADELATAVAARVFGVRRVP